MSPSRLPRSAVIWARIGILIVVIAAVALRFSVHGPLGIDSWWAGVVHLTRGSAPYAVSVSLAQIDGGIGAATCTAIAAALLFAVRAPREAVTIAVTMVVAVLCLEALKWVSVRTRPGDALIDTTGTAFPSGHSVGAAALAVSIALIVRQSSRLSPAVQKWAWPVAAMWVLLMMWSRTALGAHWLTDVVCGALLGASCAVIVHDLVMKRRA